MRDDDDLLSMLRIVRDTQVRRRSRSTVRPSPTRLGRRAHSRRAGGYPASLLIWGVQVGGRPSPCYEDLELTVQGSRLLRDSETIGTTVANDE